MNALLAPCARSRFRVSNDRSSAVLGLTINSGYLVERHISM